MSNPKKITTQHDLKIDSKSSSKPQKITLDLKPYFNIQLTASTPQLVSKRRTKTNGKNNKYKYIKVD